MCRSVCNCLLTLVKDVYRDVELLVKLPPPFSMPPNISLVGYCVFIYYIDFLVLRTENLYVILARHNEFPEDGILNVETCSSMLFVIIVFDIIVQSLVKL